MSHQRLRHFVLALILGSVPLLPPVTAQAESAAKVSSSPAAIAPQESGTLRKFRDSAPPVMAQAAKFEAGAAPRAYTSRTPVTYVPLQAVNNPRLYREVFGFAFASSLGDPNIGYPSWNMSLLSTVAYFGVHVDWTSDFSNDSGLSIWNDPSGPVPGLISTAHANGTKVVLTIEMFDSTNGTPNMCSALQRSSLTIQRVVAQLSAKGIDGVNVDYESNNTLCTDPSNGSTQWSQVLLTNFVKNLRTALGSGPYISIDTYSGAAGYRDSSGAYLGFFDIASLAAYVDSFFVMAYDMEYANWDSPPLSCPSFCLGPTAPLSTYLFNDSRASSEYRAVVSPSKIIMGIPYYGRKECVAINPPDQIPANAMGTSVAADGYLDASTEATYPGNTQYTTHREARDPLSQTRWDTFSSTAAGCNREMYWDDATALGNKYNLVINDHLRGAGIFALNYGGGAPELWNLINLKFGQCSQAALTADKTTPQIPSTSVVFTGSALCAGTGTFRFWMQPPGGAFSIVQDYGTASTWTWDTTGKALGTYAFEVDARNQGSSVTLDTYARMSFQLALCVTPSLSTDKASPQLPTTTVTFTPSVTCQGTPEYRFLILPPSGTWTVVQDYGVGTTFKWPTSSPGYGNYNVGVHVRTTGTGVAYESYSSIPFSLTSCISAALTTNKASPQPTGTQIGLTGSATCDAAPQYRFMIQPPGASWAVVQDFGASSTFAWNGGGPGGTYNLELDAKSAPASASTIASATQTYTLNACSAVTLTTSPSPPQEPGPNVVVTASATCPGAAQYRFTVHKPDGTGGVVQDYGAANTYSWSTTGLVVGSYDLRVEARNAGATTSYEAAANTPFYLAHPPCTTPTVTTNPTSPVETGSMVTFTAGTGTCPQPQFEFWMQPSGSTTWQLLQAYSSKSTYAWNTTGALNGTEQFEVWVRDAFSLGSNCPSGRGGCNDAFTGLSYTVIAPYCASVTISATPAAVMQGNGTHVTATAAAASCTNSPLYEFWIRPVPQVNWQLVRGYSPSPTYDWNTLGANAGMVYLGVHVRDAHSTAPYDAVASAPVTVSSPCTSVTVSAAPTNVIQNSGTHVTITAAASGCTNSAAYEFWLRPAWSSTWQLVQPYGSSATYDWNSTGALTGVVYLGVHARDSQRLAAYDAVASTPVTVATPSCGSVTITATPTSVTHSTGGGTHVTATASATGCTTAPLYEFWIRPASSGTWQHVQSYSNGANYDWNSTGALPGTVYIGVHVRDANSPASYDAVASTPVTVT